MPQQGEERRLKRERATKRLMVEPAVASPTNGSARPRRQAGITPTMVEQARRARLLLR